MFLIDSLRNTIFSWSFLAPLDISQLFTGIISAIWFSSLNEIEQLTPVNGSEEDEQLESFVGGEGSNSMWKKASQGRILIVLYLSSLSGHPASGCIIELVKTQSSSSNLTPIKA